MTANGGGRSLHDFTRPYGHRDDPDEQRWINDVIESALSHSHDQAVRDGPGATFERRFSDWRRKCLNGEDAAGPERAIRILIGKLRTRMDEWIAAEGDDRRQATHDLRELRVSVQHDLAIQARDHARRLVRAHWLEFVVLISRALNRGLGVFPFAVQVASALSMLEGTSVEMATGEGKTYVGPLVVVPHAIAHRIATDAHRAFLRDKRADWFGRHVGELSAPRLGGVHVMTADPYLVRRDCASLRSVYALFGLSVAPILDGTGSSDRQLAYEADVIFGTPSRFAWDILKTWTQDLDDDFDTGIRPVAVIDELDHALVDEANTAFRLGRETAGDDGQRRMLIYQLQTFADTLIEAPALLEFDESQGRLEFTLAGHYLVSGIFGTLRGEIWNRIEAAPKLRDSAQGLHKELSEILGVVTRASEDLSAVHAAPRSEFVTFNPYTGYATIRDDSPMLAAMCRELLSAIPDEGIRGVGALLAATAVGVDLVESPRAKNVVSALRAWTAPWDPDEGRAILLPGLQALLAAGLTLNLNTDAGRTRLSANLHAVSGAATQGPDGIDLTIRNTEPGLADLFAMLVVEPVYPALLSRGVSQQDVPRVLAAVRAVLEYATGEGLDEFPIWFRRIAERYLILDHVNETVMLNDAGDEAFDSFFAGLPDRLTRTIGGERNPLLIRQYVQGLVTGVFETFTRTIHAESKVFDAWFDAQEEDADLQRLRGEVEQAIEHVLDGTASAERRDEEHDVQEDAEQRAEAQDGMEGAGEGGAVVAQSIDHAFELLKEAGAPREVVEATVQILSLGGMNFKTIEEFERVLEQPDAASASAMNTTADLIRSTFSILPRRDDFLVSMLTVIWALSRDPRGGEPPFEVALHPVDEPEWLGELLRELDKTTRVLREPYFRRVLQGKGLIAATEFQASFVKAFDDRVKGASRLLTLAFVGTAGIAGLLSFKDWAEQAAFGFLDHLRAMGLVNSYDAGFVGQVLAQSLAVTDAEDSGREYIVRPVQGTPTVDPYTGQPEQRQITIIDRITGRALPSSRWSQLVHEIIEARHNLLVRVGGPARSITMQTMQRRLYGACVGMSGTLSELESELQRIYGIRVRVSPTHAPCVRDDLPDEIYRTERAALERIGSLVQELHGAGRPVLIRCVSIDASERVQSFLSTKFERDIPLLNGRPEHASREATLIETAGSVGSILVSTQMVGRGVDIKLEDETLGLCAIAFERQDSRRADRQFAGRSGRQGDPGISVFIRTLPKLLNGLSSDRVEGLAEFFDEGQIDPDFDVRIRRFQEHAESVLSHQRIEHSLHREAIYVSDAVFATMRSAAARPMRLCPVCRDLEIDDRSEAGPVCSRCSHCLQKLRSGGPCADDFCVAHVESAAGSVNYFVADRGDPGRCAWSRVHDAYVESANPTLLHDTCTESFCLVAEELDGVALWPEWFVRHALVEGRLVTTPDVWILEELVRACLGVDIDRRSLERVIRRVGLTGQEDLRSVLEDHLRVELGDQAKVALTPWAKLAVTRDWTLEACSDPIAPGLSLAKGVSQSLYGGSPLDAELDGERAQAVTAFARRAIVAEVDAVWDAWHLRQEQIEANASAEEFFGPDGVERYCDRVAHAARSYHLLTRMRVVDRLVRVCRVAEAAREGASREALLALLSPLGSLLPDSPARMIARLERSSTDPLLVLAAACGEVDQVGAIAEAVIGGAP